jgi:hypothetical protein
MLKVIIPAVLLAYAALGLAGDVMLVSETFIPTPGTEVEFQVLGAPAGASFNWDFKGDGVVDLTSGEPRARWVMSEGYQEVAVQVLKDGAPFASARVAIVADDRLGAFRTATVAEGGAVDVLLTLRAKVHLVAPGIEESVPPGWALEVIDDGGTLYRLGDVLQAIWPLELWPGDEVSLRYRLYPPAPGSAARLSGIASAYGDQGRVVVPIAGTLIVP